MKKKLCFVESLKKNIGAFNYETFDGKLHY